MNTVVIACETLEDEILFAMKKANCNYPIVWIEFGLHEDPVKLNKRIQEEIDKVDNQYEYILLGYGNCGNALRGLCTQHAKLVIPKVDDCISLMLGGDEERNIVNERDKPLFTTKGWLKFWNSTAYIDVPRWIKKYGEEKTREIYKKMFEGYKHVNLIDTGAYQISDYLKQSQDMAKNIGLQHKIIPGCLKILDNAFNETWGEEFAVLEPKQVVTEDILGRV